MGRMPVFVFVCMLLTGVRGWGAGAPLALHRPVALVAPRGASARMMSQEEQSVVYVETL